MVTTMLPFLCPRTGGRRRLASRFSFAVGILEHLVERHLEHPGDLERHLKGGGVAALLDGDDGLAGHPDALGEFACVISPRANRSARIELVILVGLLMRGYRPRR